MSAPKITDFFVAVILVGMFMSSFGIYMYSINKEYAPRDSYQAGNVSSYVKLTEIGQDIEEIQSASDIKGDKNILDIIGGLFTDAYKAMRITLNSFGLFGSMTDQAIDQANLGEFTSPFRVGVTSIIIVLLVVGVFLAAIIKRDL